MLDLSAVSTLVVGTHNPVHQYVAGRIGDCPKVIVSAGGFLSSLSMVRHGNGVPSLSLGGVLFSPQKDLAISGRAPDTAKQWANLQPSVDRMIESVVSGYLKYKLGDEVFEMYDEVDLDSLQV